MAFLAGSSIVRCACRADKQLLSVNVARTSIYQSLLHVNFSTSSARLDGSSSSPSGSAPPVQSQRSFARSRAPFVPPESYRGSTAETVPSPLTAKILPNGSTSRSRDMFGTQAKREQTKNAKKAGADYVAKQATQEPDNTLSRPSDILRPIKPSDSRTLSIDKADDFARQYRRLMNGVIGFNNIRTELRHQERYEKPKYKRQRLRSARHRRRFANEVGLRVAAVLRAKSQGM